MADNFAVSIILKANDQASANLKTVRKEVDSLDASGRATGNSFGKLGVAAAAAGAAFVAMQVAQIVGELNALGDQVGDVAATFESLGGAADNMNSLRAATRGLADDMLLQSQASMLMSTGLARNQDDAASLIGVAGDLGIAFGVELPAAVDKFTQAMNTGRVNSLADLGIDLEALKSRIADLTGAGMDNLSATRQAIMEIASATRDNLGDAILDNIDNTALLETKWENLRQKIAVGVNSAIESMAATTLDALTTLEQMAFILDHIGEVNQELNQNDILNTLQLQAGEKMGSPIFGLSQMMNLQPVGAGGTVQTNQLDNFGALFGENFDVVTSAIQEQTEVQRQMVQGLESGDWTKLLDDKARETAANTAEIAANTAEALTTLATGFGLAKGAGKEGFDPLAAYGADKQLLNPGAPVTLMSNPDATTKTPPGMSPSDVAGLFPAPTQGERPTNASIGDAIQSYLDEAPPLDTNPIQDYIERWMTGNPNGPNTNPAAFQDMWNAQPEFQGGGHGNRPIEGPTNEERGQMMQEYLDASAPLVTNTDEISTNMQEVSNVMPPIVEGTTEMGKQFAEASLQTENIKNSINDLTKGVHSVKLRVELESNSALFAELIRQTYRNHGMSVPF